jgi:hypothetical protein
LGSDYKIDSNQTREKKNPSNILFTEPNYSLIIPASQIVLNH